LRRTRAVIWKYDFVCSLSTQKLVRVPGTIVVVGGGEGVAIGVERLARRWYRSIRSRTGGVTNGGGCGLGLAVATGVATGLAAAGGGESDGVTELGADARSDVATAVGETDGRTVGADGVVGLGRATVETTITGEAAPVGGSPDGARQAKVPRLTDRRSAQTWRKPR
jgi:hypothetical protein